MLSRLGVLACLALATPQAPPAAPPELATSPVRQRLRAVTGEIARTGELALVERMQAVLLGLGDDEKSLERLRKDWERIVLSAKPGKGTRATAANKLRRELGPLIEQLGTESEPRRSELARWILALDSDEPAANAIAGRTRTAQGAWLTPEERLWDRGGRSSASDLALAGRRDFDFVAAVSDNPALLHVAGVGNRVSAAGIELDSQLETATLERILRQVLQGVALSNEVLYGRPWPPRLAPRRFVLLTSEAHSRPALDEARAAGALDEKDYQQTIDLHLVSFFDRRGWETMHWGRDVEFAAAILYRLLDDWIEPDVQPCLRVGHLNWVCLRFLGTSVPLTVWQEQVDARGVASMALKAGVPNEYLWRSARQSLWGCRAWMVRRAREGRDAPWARAILDQDGKIRDEPLLKTTLVCEMLQQEDRLADLMKATRGPRDGVKAIEEALGEDLPKLEARWHRWLEYQPPLGVVQALEREAAPAPAPEASPGTGRFDAALLLLNQARASALQKQLPSLPLVQLEPDLCRAAESHARYLTLNPDQKATWPEAHGEDPSRTGFDVEGALAGSRALISFDREPSAAVKAWFGSFYHRLPMLHPGLFGAGFGTSEEVVVLDASSLVLPPDEEHFVVWPPNEAEDVPLRFVPELPNPVPGQSLASLGYPITLQLFELEVRDVELALELFAGKPEEKKAVDCFFIAPQAPLQVELAPQSAWCLIPKAPLAKKTLYTVRARWNERGETWRFTTGE